MCRGVATRHHPGVLLRLAAVGLLLVVLADMATVNVGWLAPCYLAGVILAWWTWTVARPVLLAAGEPLNVAKLPPPAIPGDDVRGELAVLVPRPRSAVEEAERV